MCFLFCNIPKICDIGLWEDHIVFNFVFIFQVLDKYGDIYGRERIAELLGMDLASLDVSKQQTDKKPQESDNSILAW